MGQLQDYATLPLPLTSVERQELDHLEAVIDQGLPTFYAVADAMIVIRNRKLYRAEFRTFEEYCLKRWNIGRASAYRMIDAAELKEVLSPNGDKTLPENEAQVRALKAAPLNKQADIWEKARATAPAGKVTAKHIGQVIQMEIPREPECQISVFIQDETPKQVIQMEIPREPECQISVFIQDETPKMVFPIYTPQTCDICKRRYPMGLDALPDGRHVCHMCEEKIDYIVCDACGKRFPPDEHQGFTFYMTDRAKIVKAGLRLFSISGRLDTHELQELLPEKSGGKGSTWQIVEKFPSKAALQRRIQELDQDSHIVFESRI